MMRIGSLFSGIGGLELGLERAGLGAVAWQAEIDPYCREVLARHWPDARRYSDVREVDSAADRVDVLCGGFPCQPVSLAGKRRAQSDERWLWPEFARIAEALKPAVIVAENVPGLRTAGLRDVLADLAGLGFDAEWHCFRAYDFGAPHERNRIWIVATHPDRAFVRNEPGWLGRSIERQASAVGRGVGARESTDAHCQQIASRVSERPEAAGARDVDGSRADGDPDSAGESQSLSRQARARRDDVGWDGRSGESGVGIANAAALRRLESARLFAHQRGWSERCGWALDPAPRVDDGPAAGLDRGGRERARKAAGNGVVVACAQAVGQAIRESVEVIARATEAA